MLYQPEESVVRSQNMSNKLSDDFAKPFKYRLDFLGLHAVESSPDALYGQRSNLADLDPRSFRQFSGSQFKCQRELGSRLLAR